MDDTEAIAALGALAQPVRLRAFRLLVGRGGPGLPAGEIARLAGVPQNTLSPHLATLARAGLIAGERQSREIIYKALPTRVVELAGFLVDDCCGGNPQLCLPDAVARRGSCP